MKLNIKKIIKEEIQSILNEVELVKTPTLNIDLSNIKYQKGSFTSVLNKMESLGVSKETITKVANTIEKIIKSSNIPSDNATNVKTSGASTAELELTVKAFIKLLTDIPEITSKKSQLGGALSTKK